MQDKNKMTDKTKENSKMGRPTDDPKIHQTRIRMTQRELDMLNYCSEKLGKTKTDIIVEGIEEIYKSIKNK